ncbi:MAG: hypothetical protein RO009_04240 [Pseudorhodoplanes sp.]|jgi:hypothetical protein|nr:hypothetical protein [Pseudorhodoplanes sp.]
MADYYPLVARAVAGLEKNTGEARRALYERARTALVAQLRGTDPPLDEAEITRERLALEEAIRKVETEAARRARQESVAGAVPQPAAAPRPQQTTAEPRPAAPRPDSAHTPSAAPPKPLAAPQPGQNAQQPARKPLQPSAPRTSLTEEAMKGFRESAGTAAPARPAASSAPRTPPRDPFAEISASHDFDRLETKAPPRLDSDALRPKRRGTPLVESLEEIQEPEELPFNRGPRGPDETMPRLRRAPRNYGGLIKAVVAVALVAGLLGFFYWQRDTISELYSALRGAPQQAQKETPQQQGKPKISDRIGPGAQKDQAAVPAVAQRVVLYEEEPSDPQGKRFIGSAIWRTENVSSGPGQPADLAVRADVEIPERRMTMSLTIRRNTDQTLPASHTAEVMFNLPADFPGGSISNVPGILMKQAEQTRGTPLAGLAVKVTNGFFLIGLSAVESDLQRNIQLLKERSWFDIPIVYANNRRAILAIEKGTPGEKAFAEAFAAWKQ